MKKNILYICLLPSYLYSQSDLGLRVATGKGGVANGLASNFKFSFGFTRNYCK